MIQVYVMLMGKTRRTCLQLEDIQKEQGDCRLAVFSLGMIFWRCMSTIIFFVDENTRTCIGEFERFEFIYCT